MLMRFWKSVLGFCVTRALYQSDHSGRAGHQWKKTNLKVLKLYSFDLEQLARIHASACDSCKLSPDCVIVTSQGNIELEILFSG